VDFPAVYLLNLNPTSVRLVSSVGFFLAIVWTLAAQFGPKAYRIYNGDGDHMSEVVGNNMLNKKHAISPTFALKEGNPEETSSNAAVHAPNPNGVNQDQNKQQEENKEFSMKEIHPVVAALTSC